MNPTGVDPTALDHFRRHVRGDVLLPGDPGYDAARVVYNAAHEFWPALIVRPADDAEVAAVVRLARDQGLMLAVRGGNHSMRGFGSCDDGVVLDLSRMRSVDVDADARVARVGGGATWGDVNTATHAHGLATTGGVVSTTGVGGLTLGGGFGYLTRRLGLACDNLVAARIVDANGEVQQVAADRNPDLFHAMRGGGGNFGVATSFTFRLAPVSTILGGPLVFEMDAGLVRRFDALLAQAPRELGAILGLSLAPPLPFLPEDRHFEPVAIIVVCWSGGAEEGAEVVEALKSVGSLIGEGVRPMPYPEINTLFDGLLPPGLRHYWKSRLFEGLREETIRTLLEYAADTPTIESGIFAYAVDGAAHDVPAEATAWPHRDARFLVGFHGSWRDTARDAAITEWVRDAHAASAPHSLPGSYANFASDEADTASLDYRAAESRLVATKRRHDPHNLFCLNPNIEPWAAPA